MKLVTQDGRTLKVSRECRLFISGFLKGNGHGATLTVTTFTKSKWDDVPFSERHKHPGYEALPNRELVESYGVIGEYSTNTGRNKAADMLDEAWKSGATEFTVPQDTFEKSEAEKFDDFAAEHHLTLVSINELGYKPSDTARNMRTWQTTNEFERRNIIVADPTGNYDPADFGGAYSTSLAKWQALQGETA